MFSRFPGYEIMQTFYYPNHYSSIMPYNMMLADVGITGLVAKSEHELR